MAGDVIGRHRSLLLTVTYRIGPPSCRGPKTAPRTSRRDVHAIATRLILSHSDQ